MSEIASEQIDRFNAPYGKEVTLEEVHYNNGFRMLRMRIREARRFTVIDLDPVTARHWGGVLSRWAESQPLETEAGSAGDDGPERG